MSWFTVFVKVLKLFTFLGCWSFLFSAFNFLKMMCINLLKFCYVCYLIIGSGYKYIFYLLFFYLNYLLVLLLFYYSFLFFCCCCCKTHPYQNGCIVWLKLWCWDDPYVWVTNTCVQFRSDVVSLNIEIQLPCGLIDLIKTHFPGAVFQGIKCAKVWEVWFEIHLST